MPYIQIYNFFISLSNGEDFITTEQLQKRMRSLSSPSTSSADFFQSNNTSSNSSPKGLGDNDNDCFPRNGLPDDSPSTKDEDRTSDVRGKKFVLKFFISFFFIAFFVLTCVLLHNYRLDGPE